MWHVIQPYVTGAVLGHLLWRLIEWYRIRRVVRAIKRSVEAAPPSSREDERDTGR